MHNPLSRHLFKCIFFSKHSILHCKTWHKFSPTSTIKSINKHTNAVKFRCHVCFTKFLLWDNWFSYLKAAPGRHCLSTAHMLLSGSCPIPQATLENCNVITIIQCYTAALLNSQTSMSAHFTISFTGHKLGWLWSLPPFSLHWSHHRDKKSCRPQMAIFFKSFCFDAEKVTSQKRSFSGCKLF